MRKFITLLTALMCVFTLNAQLKVKPQGEAAVFKKTAQNLTSLSKTRAIVNDDPIPEGYCRVILTVGNVWGDGTGYQMLIASEEYAPMAFMNADPTVDIHSAVYGMFEYKIPENADGALNSPNVVFENSVQIDIPAGEYYFLFPLPGGDQMYLAEASYFSWNFEELTTCSFSIEYSVQEQGDIVLLDVFAYGFPAEITDFTVTPAADETLSCDLAWTNPSIDVMGEPLDDLLSVTIKRNGEIIKTIENPTMGAAETWTDNPSDPGFYTYSIYATSSVRYGPEFVAEVVFVGINPCNEPISEFPYHEGFESGSFPFCWTIIDHDGDENDGWEVISFMGANETGSSIRHADIRGEQDNWFVMQQISVPADGNNFVLSFYDFVAAPNYYVKNSVLISEGSADPADGDFVEVWTPEEAVAAWQHNMVSLASYAGKDIYIAFRYEGNWAHFWYIDEIKVEAFDLTDAALLSIVLPETGLDLSDETVFVIIKNNGNEAIENAKVSISVNGTQVLEETVTESIPSMSQYTYTFEGTIDLSEVRVHDIEATVTIDGDEVANNNTVTKEVRNYGPIAVMGMVSEMTTCDIEFFDDGVEENYIYGYYEKQTITFLPAEEGKRLQVEFDMLDLTPGFDAGGNMVRGDSLYIYEGVIVENAYKIASLGGLITTEDVRVFTSGSADGALTFVFDKAGNNAPASGWEAQITCYDPNPWDVAVTQIVSPVKGGDAEAEVSVRVHNYGGETIEVLPIAYIFNGGEPVMENAAISLQPGMSDVYTFTATLNLEEYNDNYELEVYTMLEGDFDTSNDRASISFFYRPAVEISAFLSFYPSARISFDSNAPEQINTLNELNLGYGLFPFAVFYYDEHIYVISIDAGYNPMYTRQIIKYAAGDFSEVSRVDINIQVPLVDATYDYVSKTVYGTSMNTHSMASELYTLDLETGAMNMVGEMEHYVGGIACNLEGKLYGLTFDGKLCVINKATAELTEVHQLSISNHSKGFEGLVFDLESGRLFNNNATGGGFTEIDIETGRVQAAGKINNGASAYVGMYIPYEEDDVALKPVSHDAFAVYPNPTNGIVNVPVLPESAVITLRDVTGKVVDRQVLNGKTQLEYNVPAGIYLMEITCNGKNHNQKLIVK